MMRFFGQNWTKNQVINGQMDIDHIYIVVIKHLFIAEQNQPNNSLSFGTLKNCWVLWKDSPILPDQCISVDLYIKSP